MDHADSSQASLASQSQRACHECNRKKTKCDMKRPTCGLCQRIGNVCTFPTKRKAPDSRKLSAGRQTRRFSDNFGQFESLTHAETDLLDRLIALLQAQSSSSEKLEDYLAAYSRSSAETHSPVMSVSPISSGEKGPPNENTSLPSATGAGSRLSTQLSTNASESTAKPIGNAKVSLAIPQAVSAGLIEAFFENIQPWLPMLHRPRFLARYADLSKSCSDGFQGLPVDEALLLYGIFALAARFSSSEFFGDVPPIQRGDRFAEEAESLYEQARAISTPTLTYLQGCILLAFYYYTSKPCPHSWILTGVCVRIAYELDLAEIDADEIQNLTPAAWVEKEEMRRAWWLVWELDTFGSTMSNRPYTIDRRRMAVMFPVSDEAWFSETPQSSLKLNTCPGMSWKSLSGGGKLDERAWFLFANYLMSLTLDMSQRKDGVSADEKLTLENEISCFKLSLPTSFRLDTEVLPFDAQSFARSNWIIGTNLMLMTTSVFLSSIKVAEPSHCSHDDPALDTTLPLRIRAMELSRIVTRWSPGYISLSHPFFAASTILPVHLSESSFAISQPTIASSQELGKRLLAQFGQVWKLGSVLLQLATILETSRTLSPQELRLARRFAVFFPQSIKSADIANVKQVAEISPQSSANDQQNTENSTTIGTLPARVAIEGYDCSWTDDTMGSSVLGTTQLSMMMNHQNPEMDFSFLDFFGGLEGQDPMLA